MPGTTGLRCNSAPPASDTPALKTGEIRVIEARTDVVGSLLRPPELLAARQSGELVIVAHVPPTPPRHAPVVADDQFYRLPAFAIVGDGYRASPRSGTTRQPGVVSAIDVAPTVLDHLDPGVYQFVITLSSRKKAPTKTLGFKVGTCTFQSLTAKL